MFCITTKYKTGPPAVPHRRSHTDDRTIGPMTGEPTKRPKKNDHDDAKPCAKCLLTSTKSHDFSSEKIRYTDSPVTAINKMVCMIRRIKQCKITFCKTTKRNRNETVGNQFESGEFKTYIGIEKIGSRFMHLRNHEVKNVWQFPPVEDVHIFS